MARRQAGDAEDVIFSFEAFKNNHPQLFGLLPPRHQGREDRRARGHLHLRRRRQPRTAADRRPAQRAAEALVGGHRQGRQEARRRRDHARAAARQRRLPDQGVRRRAAPSSTSACKDYWGKDLNVNIGRDNFDEMRFEYFRDATVALEAFKADAVDWRTENSAKNWATAYDFPAVKDKRVVKEEFPIRSSGVHAGLRLQHPRRDKFKDPRVRRAFNLRVRFRGDEQADVLRPVQAHRTAISRAPSLRRAGCRRARSSRSSKPCATRCRPRCSPRPTPIRSAAIPKRCAHNLREALRLLQRGRLRGAQPEAGQRQDRRAVHRRIPDRRSGLRALRAVLQAVARTARHHDVASARRRRAVREPAAQLGLRHHHRELGPVAVARQRAARLSGARRPPISRARAISSASRIRRSTR